MLKTLFKIIPTAIRIGDAKASTPAVSLLGGYYAPEQSTEILAAPQCRQWLQMLWDYSSLPKDLYQQYYLQPLEHCVTLMQQFPATESDHHAYLGGMVDHLLETVAYAARLSKNYLLPVGAQPEDQASQSTAWNAVIVYAAMLQSLDRLCQIEVELESGLRWMPLTAVPGEPYRFRFKPIADVTQVQSLSAMLAWKIIPDEALIWLSAWPEVLKTLALYLTGFRNEAGIVNAIVSEAIHTSIGKTSPLVEPVSTLTPSVTFDLPEQHSSQPSVEHVAQVNLASSLDSAIVEPMRQEEDITSDLLTVMGFSQSISMVEGEQEISAQTTMGTTGSRDKMASSELGEIGEKFWRWLSQGCCSGTFPVNTANARIHIIAGYVFIHTPSLFHQFLSENRECSEDKANLQNAFERLGRHRQDKGQMYTCHVYQNEVGEGRFQKMTGYLIVAKKLYKRHDIPENNPFAIIKT